MRSIHRVGLIINSVASGGKTGGVERFFIKFYNWVCENHSEGKVVLITNRKSLENLKSLVEIRNSDRIILLPVFSNRFKLVLESLALIYCCLIHRVRIVQITNFNKGSDMLFYFLKNQIVRSLTTIKVIATIVDCEIPYAITLNARSNHREYINRYSSLFEASYIDAVITWYSEFKEWANQNNSFTKEVPIVQIRSRFTIAKNQCIPFVDKENTIIWAGRLVEQKRPFMFLQALRLVKDSEARLLENWQVKLFGFGKLKSEVEKFVIENDLESTVLILDSNCLDDEFQKSKLFVSTQAFENYPSQAMNEAMIYGNALVAFNLGDTELFLKNNENGIMPKGETIEHLALALVEYLESDSKEAFYQESIRICMNTHNPSNFYKKINAIWTDVGENN